MLDNFVSQLRGNPRLRWGIALIIGIFWFYGVLLLRETLEEENQRHQAAGQSIARLSAQLAQPEWTTRVQPAKVMAVQLEGGLWQAPTSGLAQAAFQDWLNAALAEVGATRPLITVTVIDERVADATAQSQDTDAATPTDLWKIQAKLGFEFTAPILMGFLNQIENNPKQIVVVTLNVRREPVPHVEMELVAHFQKQAGPAAPLAKSGVK